METGRPVPSTPPKGSLMGGPGENRPSQSWVASDLAAKTRTQAPSFCRMNTSVSLGIWSWEPKDARWLRVPRAQTKIPGHGCRILGLSANLFQGLGQTCHTELLPLKRTSDTRILCTWGKFKARGGSGFASSWICHIRGERVPSFICMAGPWPFPPPHRAPVGLAVPMGSQVSRSLHPKAEQLASYPWRPF